MYRKNYKIWQLLSLIAVLASLLGTAAQAEEISLTEAFQRGRENNPELRELKEELLTLERGLTQLMSSLDWQVDFSGQTSYGKRDEIKGLMQTYYPVDNKLKEEGGQLSLSLQSKKTYLFGLNIKSNLSITEVQPFKFENFEEKYDYSLDLSQRLYPLLPSEEEKKYYRLENEWKIAQIQRAALLKTREIDWLELYFKLDSLKKSQQLLAQNYRLVEAKAEQVLEQYNIGEAGKTQLLAARIELKEAEIALKDARSKEEQASSGFAQALGLDEGQLKLVDAEKYIDQLPAGDLNYQDLDGLMELVVNDNTRLRVLKRKFAFQERELKWQKAEGKPQLNAVGNYKHNPGTDDEWVIGLGVIYNIFDSGRQEIALAEQLAELESLQLERQQLLQKLRSELTGLQNQLALNLLNLDGKRLALEKAELELELAAEQLKEGIITEQQYQQQILREKQAEIDRETAQHQVLISKRRIIDFVGL